MKRRLTYATFVAFLGLVPLACSHDPQALDEQTLEGDEAGKGLEDAASVAQEDEVLSAQDNTNQDMFTKADKAAAAPMEAEPTDMVENQDPKVEEEVAPAVNLAATEEPSSETTGEAVNPQDEIESNPDFTLAARGTNTEPKRKGKKEKSPSAASAPIFEPIKTEVVAVEPTKKEVKKRTKREHAATIASKTERQAAAPVDPVSQDTTTASPVETQTARATATGTDGNLSVYIVTPGDTLSKIARRIYGNKDEWRTLAQINGINQPERILPGQVLRFATDDRTAKFQQKFEGAKEQVVVQAGDTLGGLAKRLMGKASYWKALWQINSDKVSDPNVIKTNQVLFYFDMSKVSAAENTATAY